MRPDLRSLLPLLLLAGTLVVAPSALARNDATAGDWQADLQLLIEEIEAVHPDPWFHTDRATVVAAAEALHERLPRLSWEESYTEFHRIIAMIRDGHTGVRSHRSPALNLRRVQVQYHLFPDGLHVIAVHPDHTEILGGRVVRIGNTGVDEAMARIEPLVSADNEWTVRDRAPRDLTSADLLVGLGILAGTDKCEVEVEKDGRRVRAVLPTDSTHHEAGWPSALEQSGVTLPLYLRHPERSYFFEHLSEENAVYLLFRRVANDEGESFEEFCERTFAYLDEHEVDKLVVDLRLNGGGNNFLNRPLIHGIIRNERVNRKSGLFVIVGRRTFSAAMCGTIDLERQTSALFAGEPTGATPNHHGDAVPIELPRTGLTVRISSLHWQNSDPRDRRPWVEPDVPVPLTWDDYIHGRDPVLAAVLDYQEVERQSIGKLMGEWLRNGQSLDATIARYHELSGSADRGHYDFGEYQLNAVGYELLGEGRTDDAITVFRLNTDVHALASNPWDSLGETLAGTGRTVEAIEAYRKSVELNPSNRAGQTALRTLRREVARID